MPNAVHPVLSVVVRQFRQEHECDVERSLVKIQHAVTAQPGFVGLQSSLSTAEDCCELVTVFAFDLHDNLNRWKMLLVSVSVVLISYVLLPWSCKMLTRLKARIDKKGV